MHILQCWMAVNSCVCSLQPWAFQAREFLRKKLIGKEICFTVENKTPQGREYGIVYLGRGEWCLFTKKSLTATVLIWNVCVYCSVVIVTLLISPKTPQEKISQSPWWPKGLPQFAEKASEETSKNPECPPPPPNVKPPVSVQFLHLLSKPSQCWLCFPLQLRLFVSSQWVYCKNKLLGAVFAFNEVTLDILWR